MNEELEKLLTVKLLSEVFDFKVDTVILDKPSENQFSYEYIHIKDKKKCLSAMPYDTLTKQMKAYCIKNKYAVRVDTHYMNTHVPNLLKMYTNRGWFIPCKSTFKSELIAMVNVTQWVINQTKEETIND